MSKELIKSIYDPLVFNNSNKSQIFDEDTRYYSFARVALLKILEGLKLQKGDEVLLPSLICKDVLGPINQLGLVPKYYEINEKLEPTELPKTGIEKVRVCLYVNYFGFSANQSLFLDYCQSHEIVSIEDNAHGFLSMNNGKYLGLNGDFGIFSIRKTLPISVGACYTKNNKDLTFQAEDSNPIDHVAITKRKLRGLARTFGPKNMQRLTAGLRKIRKIRTGSEIPLEEGDSEFQVQPSLLQVDIKEYLEKLDIKSETQRRRQLYQVVTKILSHHRGKLIFEELDDEVVPYVVPFTCSDEDLKVLNKEFYNYGLEIFSWPELPSEIKNNCPQFYREIRAVRLLW